MVFCLSDVPNEINIATRQRNQCCFSEMSGASAAHKDAFGNWGYWSAPNGNGYRVPCLFQRKILALGIFSCLFLARCTSASQWVLIDWECHLQSLNLLPPTSPPGFACYIVLHSSCPSIKYGQDSGALLLRDVCALSTFLPTPKSCQSHGPPGASSKPGKQGTDVWNDFLFTFFFFLEWGFLITWLCMQTLKEH